MIFLAGLPPETARFESHLKPTEVFAVNRRDDMTAFDFSSPQTFAFDARYLFQFIFKMRTEIFYQG